MIALRPVKNCVDRVESPALVEDNSVLENILALEHDASAVEIIEQELGFALELGLFAELAKLGLSQRPMTPLIAPQFGVGGAHGFELRLDAMSRDADRRDTLSLAQIADGFRKFLDEVCAAAIFGRTEVHQAVTAEGLFDDCLRNRADVLVAGPIAPRLDDRQGAIAPAEMPDVVDPIEERLIAKNHHIAFVLRPALEVFCPQQGENGVVSHEQRMRALVDVLAAEVPHLQLDFGGAVSCREPGGNNRDAMGGIAVQLKLFSG